MATATWLDAGGASNLTILKMSNATGNISWSVAATAPSHDQSAGSAVTFTIGKGGGGGGLNPANPDTLTLEVYADNDTSTILASLTLNPTLGTQTATVYLSNTPGAAGGAARCGMFRLNLHAVNTTAGAGATYNIDSDGVHASLVTGGTLTTHASPTVRSNTTVTTALSTTQGGGRPALFAYSDPVWVRLTLGCPIIGGVGESITVAVGAITSAGLSVAGGSSQVDHQFGVTDNRFPAAATVENLATTVGTASVQPSGAVAWIAPTTTTNDSDTFDPRLTFTHLHQDNDNTYGTPPTSKEAGAQRLASNLGFMSARVTNANGVGINGITWHMTLQDAGALTAAITSSPDPTSATEGGQDGWANSFLTWASALPTGNWTKTCTITAPAGALGTEVGNTATYKLVAANPNYRIICAGGPATVALDARHFTPGDPFLVGIAVINTDTFQLMSLDTSPAPAVAIGRFNLTYGRAEFLAADGTTWVAATGASVYFHTCTVSPGDPNAWTLTFNGTQTSGWGNADVFIIGSAFIGGVPVNDFYKEIVVNGINNHDKYAPSISWLGLPDGK